LIRALCVERAPELGARFVEVAFELEPERVERLASRLRPTFRDVETALMGFASFLERLADDV